MQEDQEIDTRTKTTNAVDEALSRLVVGPRAVPGTKLPTERALAEQLKVPRSAIRTALARLEALGRVVRVVGSGTYVAEVSKDTRASARDASPVEIMEARIAVEPSLAALVIANANSADFQKIAGAMVEAENAPDFAAFELWDGRLHQALADSSHNRLLIGIYEMITESRDLAEWGDLKRRSVTDERRRVYEEEHRRIVDALFARDAKGAEEAILTHLHTVRRNLFGM